ncbi:MAG: hypothetical protein HY907_14300 [Deltaproteobacteria bacterium]|nr:hypothetical protein [Deltaproteobacteria bacterium]
MPKTRNESISSLPVIDLAYAVGRLVDMGKATAAEILRLAAERGARIAELQAELSALRQGIAVATAPAARPAAVRKPAAAKKPTAAAKKPARAGKPAVVARPAAAKKPAVAKAPAPKKLTITPQRAAQLKVQGTYIGMMRSLALPEKAKIKAIAKEKGMPAAIAAMKKLSRK